MNSWLTYLSGFLWIHSTCTNHNEFKPTMTLHSWTSCWLEKTISCPLISVFWFFFFFLSRYNSFIYAYARAAFPGKTHFLAIIAEWSSYLIISGQWDLRRHGSESNLTWTFPLFLFILLVERWHEERSSQDPQTEATCWRWKRHLPVP